MTLKTNLKRNSGGEKRVILQTKVIFFIATNIIFKVTQYCLCFLTSPIYTRLSAHHPHKTNDCYFLFFWRNSAKRARAASFTRFLDHTERRTTVSRTPLDE